MNLIELMLVAEPVQWLFYDKCQVFVSITGSLDWTR